MIHVALTCDWLVSGDSMSPVATVWQLLALRLQLHAFFSWFIYFFHFFFFKDKLALAHFPKKEDAYFCLFVCHAGTHVMREWTPSSTKLIIARAYNLWTSAASLVRRRWSAECKKSRQRQICPLTLERETYLSLDANRLLLSFGTQTQNFSFRWHLKLSPKY